MWKDDDDVLEAGKQTIQTQNDFLNSAFKGIFTYYVFL